MLETTVFGSDATGWALLASPAFWALMVYPLCLLAAAGSDLYRFIIPDWTSIGLLVGWVAAFGVAGMSWDAFAAQSLVLVIAFVVALGLYELRVWCGGDVKLAPAALVWLDWPAALNAVLYMSYIGFAVGVLGLIAQQTARLWRPRRARATATLGKGGDPSDMDGIAYGTHVPFGVAIALGCLLAFPQSAIAERLSPGIGAWADGVATAAWAALGL